MICTLTARRLNPGAYDAFRADFDAIEENVPKEVNQRWTKVYVNRDVTDPDVVLTFGFFDGTLDELREVQAVYGREAPIDRLAEHVAEVLLDGSYEVVEEIAP